jgi:LysR family transcriptional regulator, benzoate and cis,cis-muconate-responsive activator of ben and cat genes
VSSHAHLVSRHAVGIICSAESPLAGLSTVRPSMVANNELIVYRAKDFPEYHKWIAGILGVSLGGLIPVQECDHVLGVIAAVEGGRGLAIVASEETGNLKRLRLLKRQG